MFAVYASIHVPRLDLDAVKITQEGPLEGKNCIWKEGGVWKLQIAKWKKVANQTRVQNLDPVICELLDTSLEHCPREFLFETSKHKPYTPEYLAEGLLRWETSNRLMRYACDTYMWSNNSMTYAERQEVALDMNHTLNVSLQSYNKPALNKRQKIETNN